MRDDPGALDTINTEETRPGSPEHLTWGLTLLYHPDLSRVGEIAPLFSERLGGKRTLSRVDLPFFRDKTSAGEPLNTPVISRRTLTFATDASGALCIEPESGAVFVTVNGEPLVTQRVFPRSELDAGLVIELSKSALLLLHWVELPDPTVLDGGWKLLGASRAVAHLRAEIERVAQVNVPVLIRGPSGAGKELVAEAIHQRSLRRSKPYVAVNMAALHGETATAALFGHTRAAFTGATHASLGYFGAAEGGTLFLDEVGEVPRALQGQLLRALREGEIQPLGEVRPRRIDVRIVSATDADLEQLVEAERFALPLLRRLDALTIEVPALRQRRDDVARLFLHFLRRELTQFGRGEYLREPEAGHKPWLPLRVLRAVVQYHWPGNVAELQSVAARLVLDSLESPRCVMSDALARRLGAAPGQARLSTMPPVDTVQSGNAVQPVNTNPPAPVRMSSVDGSGSGAPSAPVRRDVRTIQDAEIAGVMRECGFKVKVAAEQLGVSRSWLNTRLEHCEGVRKSKQLTDAEIEEAGCRFNWDVSQMAAELEVSEHGLKLRMPPR